MQTSKSMLSNKKVDILKEEFKVYIQTKYSHLKDKSVILSDAFYLYRHDVGIRLWEALENEHSMKRCQGLLEAYFTSEHKVKNPTSNTNTYMRSIKILTEFIDNKYGGVKALIENDKHKIHYPRRTCT
ncbi:hypothetical protein [Bacillus sp. AG4(2022)]|uniref:hypothetical protein n=1 Tax=Bacillus sp. AG4(2022) TaxID=2962594 RepID=UPI0028821722|nr:hypothetical protein [Bacillus sp. AG4(2022)]MDT0160701.1 hypothetical protein [Bacillus sp. AG4(2022)]